MDRRNFILKSLAAAAMAGAGVAPARLFAGEKSTAAARNIEASSPKFRTKFAPNIYKWTNLFPISTKGMTVKENMDFLGELGFIAFEDNDFLSRPPETQEIILEATKKYGMEFGVFTVPIKEKFAMTTNIMGKSRQPDKAAALEYTARAAELAASTAKRIGAKWITVVPGYLHEHRRNFDVFANVLEHLRAMAKICESYGAIMVLEPLSHLAHSGVWLKTTAQAYALCKAVNSPSCKILFDVYHQQIDEGNLFNNIETHFEEIAYFHFGDVPKRTEPLSGEIYYNNLVRHIMKLGYRGIMGMEHRLSNHTVDGERNMMRVYRALDDAAVSATA